MCGVWVSQTLTGRERLAWCAPGGGSRGGAEGGSSGALDGGSSEEAEGGSRGEAEGGSRGEDESGSRGVLSQTLTIAPVCVMRSL